MSTTTIEATILRNLIHNEEFVRKVLPFLKEEYFNQSEQKFVFAFIDNFVKKYNKPATIEALEISLQNSSLNEGQFGDVSLLLKTLSSKEETNNDWLVDQAEKFCKDKAIYNAIVNSIQILDGKDKHQTKDGIPSLLQEALGVCFDTSVGHDYIDNADNRFDFYHKKEVKIPFDLEIFNKITQGGLPTKTLNIVLAGTGVGKSLFMCHMAASCLAQGKNVLYITLEMAEERIAERLDANLLNTEIDQIKEIPKSTFNKRITKLATKTTGKLIIKEYPTASAHAGHFKTLLSELYLKRQFKPEIVFIDYLNICASSRYKPGGAINSYMYVKAIAEELRGLAVEYNVPVVSATQTTRSGFANTDVDLTDTSESFGLPATADFMFALISTEELEQLNQLMVKQLKNRYNDPTFHKRFMIGVDRAKMRLYDVESSAQSNIVNSGIELDNKELEDYSFDKMFKKKDFSGIKL